MNIICSWNNGKFNGINLKDFFTTVEYILSLGRMSYELNMLDRRFVDLDKDLGLGYIYW